MKRNSFKKMLAAICLLAIAAPISLSVVACGKHSHQKLPTTNSEWVIYGINNTTYKLPIMAGALGLKKLKAAVAYDFINEKLDERIQSMFEQEDFTVTKITDEHDNELKDSNFSEIGVIKAKINYDYAEHRNQITNLEITVTDEKIMLDELFRDFNFYDSKKIPHFLDSTDKNDIIDQIKVKLKISSLEEVKLSLDTPTRNSIVLKAASESSEYAGEVTLFWDLKLFEIYGQEINNPKSNNSWIKKGLKGFFFLEHGTNKIKYYNAVWYFDWRDNSELDSRYSGAYHKFIFNNGKEQKLFNFEGKMQTNEVSDKFNEFDFFEGVTVQIDTPEISNVKIFSKNKNDWESLTKKNSSFNINNSGEIKQAK